MLTQGFPQNKKIGGGFLKSALSLLWTSDGESGDMPPEYF